MIPGIKVDKGTHNLAGCPGEVVTEGLDGLRDRLAEYYKLGARFAKWRAVINIGDDIPSGTCIDANTHALARYAALCQEQGLVPMVEPEVIMDCSHDIDECYQVTEVTLRSLFNSLVEHNLVARTDLGRAMRLVLAGHTDTVPPNGNERARREGDVLWGLGAADMKSGVTVLLELARRVEAPAVDVTYVFYECEEVEDQRDRVRNRRRQAQQPGDEQHGGNYRKDGHCGSNRGIAANGLPGGADNRAKRRSCWCHCVTCDIA
jgi:hypothetical protein